MKKLIKIALPLLDIILIPFVFFATALLWFVRKARVSKLSITKKILLYIGVFPIIRHYYEPMFDTRELTKSLSSDRSLPGINLNNNGQVEMLNKFNFEEETRDLPLEKESEDSYYLNNGTFGPGDAEYWYNIIRISKPKIIIEIGSGYSTLMAIKAINKNKEEDSSYNCEHYCIEPYEMPWLEKSGVTVIRKKVENVEKSFFRKLEKSDILFIDSSHVIRPQSDVLVEYLEILPILNPGVIVHIHDIFSPKDYPEDWIKNEVRFWNEQYLVEAFLTMNNDWKVIGGLNYLYHNHFEKLKEKCPNLSYNREPCSFYIKRIIKD